MIILGIDPGSRTAGFAVIRVAGRQIEYVDSGIMKYGHITEFIFRLGEIYHSCEKLVHDYNPDEVVFESLIYVKSPTALMKLAQARGAMISAILRSHKDNVTEYSPNMVKQTLAGHGHASKESVQKSLELIFGDKTFKTHDESDALAIAVCHALHRGLNKKPQQMSSGDARDKVSQMSKRSLRSFAKSLESKL